MGRFLVRVILFFSSFEIVIAADRSDLIEAALIEEFKTEIGQEKQEMEDYYKKFAEEAAERLKNPHPEEVKRPKPSPQEYYELDPDTSVITEAVNETNRFIEFKKTKWNEKLNEYSLIQLENQFSAVRQQGNAGTCSTFASMGLLEAAYFRETGEKPDFSEMWVMRAILGKALLDSKHTIFRAFDLSLNLETLLDVVRRRGVCSENNYPYSDYGVNLFSESLSKNLEKAYRNNLIKFARYFRLMAALKSCAEEAESSRSEFEGFIASSIREVSLKKVLHFLSFGIPLHVVITFLPGGGPMSAFHAVVLTGYDQYMKRFSIRNSWGIQGRMHTPTTLPYEMMKSGKSGPTMFGFEYVLSSKDIERACKNPDIAPKQILIFCKNV